MDAPPNLLAQNSVEEENQENRLSQLPNDGATESSPGFSAEEVRSALETSASTGKFWTTNGTLQSHSAFLSRLDWEKLRSVLSYSLKQVLSEYPEAKMTTEQQISTLGETFEELVKRLDDALYCFYEGPPFTLQRLCEILLTARSIYPKLSKLSLALEKNLLVTSALTKSTDQSAPTTIQNSNGSFQESHITQQPQSSSVENGVEPSIGDKDEVMAEAQEAEVDDEATVKMETTEEEVKSSESNPTPMVDS
ncbi:uncharacterized protein LOC127259725 isoform X1 [Andrographis paniculata]|uniref:uncharacterized protein LOC127259725 isoform X1 n=1 Tax=Andrographis paniculata TaxID=175694 RepID=UPI0021E9228B|nr:uncharacterized protein LOC127259725 isoform X1 [Andrographis paniculata]